MPHGSHIYAKASDMEYATMWTYTQSEHALPHWKCVFWCCADCPCINITDQGTTKKHDETTPSIRFHIYHIIGRCTSNGRITLKDKKICYMCEQRSLPDKSTKIYTRKELVMMETSISDFRTSFYIPSIQKLAFRLPHVRILGTNHCGEMWHTAFKRRELFQDIICCRDYAERVVASFTNQIQYEYYGVNRSVSIEGISLEHFSAALQVDINSSTLSRPRHAVFHSFLSVDSKQDAATTTAHSKRLI